jgi:hypothetical protein
MSRGLRSLLAPAAGLTGDTLAERRQIRENYLRELAAKIAAGPERQDGGFTEAELLLRRQRIYRDPHGRRRQEPAACAPHGSQVRE